MAEEEKKEIIPEEEERVEEKPKSKKKLIVVVAAIVLLLGAGGGYYMYMQKKEAEAVARAEAQRKEINSKKELIFYDLGEKFINLNTGATTTTFLKIKVTFEIEGDENMEAVNKLMPRIDDVMQVYLRELRPSDLYGSVGMYRLREELLLRVNRVIHPAYINDILFKEVLMQ